MIFGGVLNRIRILFIVFRERCATEFTGKNKGDGFKEACEVDRIFHGVFIRERNQMK